MPTSEVIPYRPLGVIVTMLETLGFKVTHCHEDLVFIEHNAFLVQMGEKGEEVFIWFNVDCDAQKCTEIMEGFNQQAGQLNFNICNSGTYTLVANEADETLQLEFLPA